MKKFDAIVVGGSYAGLSAALQLARAHRQIAVVDAGQRRNRFADTSHGFLGQDGRSPQAIVDEAKAQLLAYPNVEWLSETAEFADKLPLPVLPWLRAERWSHRCARQWAYVGAPGHTAARLGTGHVIPQPCIRAGRSAGQGSRATWCHYRACTRCALVGGGNRRDGRRPEAGNGWPFHDQRHADGEPAGRATR